MTPADDPPRFYLAAHFEQTRFQLCVGTVQAYVYRHTPFFMQHFGCTTYERDRPILSERRRQVAQAIVDLMTDGALSPEEGMERLNREAFW